MRIKAYTVQIESGAICEAFTIPTSSEARAVLQAWNRFEKMVSAERFEHAQITGIAAIAEPTKEAKK